MSNIEFKNKNNNKKSKNPPVWRNKEIDWKSMDFETKVQTWKRESMERIRCLKGEFVSNNEQFKQDIRESKDRQAREKKWNRG